MTGHKELNEVYMLVYMLQYGYSTMNICTVNAEQ